ncbi:hypothetical protein SAMN05421736_115103 [Evansella caseinilytica]|uniref:Uncharacterized protein n=1 Tax=Evansella caseinilytica TaxID=1503961 RepID=A0A1H3TQL0_9BACI|nr:hypothetical protein SAMN05421736_115103 [Evansella caseinilytica]
MGKQLLKKKWSIIELVNKLQKQGVQAEVCKRVSTSQ